MARRAAAIVCLLALLACAVIAEASDTTSLRRRGLSQSKAPNLKPGNPRQNGRPVRGGRVENAKNEMCYGICTTCVCDIGEQLNCCVREGKDKFDGCVSGNALSLCSTSRPVNSCCR